MRTTFSMSHHLMRTSLSLFHCLLLLTAGRSEQAILWCTVRINWYADDSLKILLLAYDPCWAIQHLCLHWLKDRHCRAKHGEVSVDYELLDIVLLRRRSTKHINLMSTGFFWLFLWSFAWMFLDNLSSCVHLEEITPTLIQFFVGFLMGGGGEGDLKCSEWSEIYFANINHANSCCKGSHFWF